MKSLIIEYTSNIYPERLRNIEKPPSRLYAIGNISILNENGIAVVGSRTNTKYGEKMCKIFVKDLVEYNINIISGLAYGIDSIAHETCIKNSGKTIAVLPSGLNNICSATNINLVEEIIKNEGVIITEYEDNEEASYQKFLERNRIVAGMSMGTLVVEAGYRSGTSVTARYTVESGNKLFCIPSSLENIKGKTTNLLIQEGARLVTSADDIIKQFENELKIEFFRKSSKKRNVDINIPRELLEVYSVIRDKPKDINQIARETNLSINEVNSKIMLLQLNDNISEIPGQRYIRNES